MTTSLVGRAPDDTIAQEVRKPPQLDEHKLRANIALRASIGFRSDMTYVRAVASASNAPQDEAAGAVFTPIEARELQIRRDLEADSQVVEAYFATSQDRQAALAGMYIDHTTGGQLVLQLGQRQRGAIDLKPLLPRLRHADRLRVESVPWTRQHLVQQKSAITQVAPRHLQLRAVVLDEAANQVPVVINPATAGAPAGAKVPKEQLSLISPLSWLIRQSSLSRDQSSQHHRWFGQGSSGLPSTVVPSAPSLLRSSMMANPRC